MVLLTAVTDYLFLAKYFFLISSMETLVTVNSILLAAAGIMYQVQATNEREIQFKVHQQRKETYDELLVVVEGLLKRQNDIYVDDKGRKVDNWYKISERLEPEPNIREMEDDYRRLRPKLMIYASPQVIDFYTEIQRTGLQQSDLGIIIRKWGRLYQQIRSEVVFADRDVPTRKLLSLTFNFIYEPSYDGLFDKDGYLK